MEESALAVLCSAQSNVVCLSVGLSSCFHLAVGGWRVFGLDVEEPVPKFVEACESRLFSPLLE